MEHPGPQHAPKTESINSKTLHRKSMEYKDGDSDSDLAHPQQQTRNRQKKFIKNFKQLPSKEIVLERKLNSNYQLFITKENVKKNRGKNECSQLSIFRLFLCIGW